MALITDLSYVLHTLKLSYLRSTTDSVSAGIIDLDETSSGDGPWVRASGGRDSERWPEMNTIHSPVPVLSSPPPNRSALGRNARSNRRSINQQPPTSPSAPNRASFKGDAHPSGTSLNYSRTISSENQRIIGAGMRVSGAVRHRPRPLPFRATRTTMDSSEGVKGKQAFLESIKSGARPGNRKRSDSAPLPGPTSPDISISDTERTETEDSMSITSGAGPPFERRRQRQVNNLGESGQEEEDEEDEEFLANRLDEDDEKYDGFDENLDGMPPRLGDEPGGDGSDEELGIEREQEDLLEGFREDVLAGEMLKEESQRGAFLEIREEENDLEDKVDGSSYRPSPAKRTPSPPPSFAPIDLPKLLSASKPSGLSLLIKSNSTGAPTPFSAYARIVPPPNTTNVPVFNLSLYFPHSSQPLKPIKTKVRKDSTVEEIVGLGLFLYGEEGRKPELSAGFETEGRDRDIRLSTVGWGLRIVEDDGEVDEDFPALDREANVAKFSFSEFAITVATATQVNQNLLKTPLPPRPTATKARGNSISAQTQQPTAPGGLVKQESFVSEGRSDHGMPLRPSVPGIPVLLKVTVVNAADIRFTTTLSVTSATYLADVVDLVYVKKRMPDRPKDWVLCLSDLSLILPLDRTVESLMGVTSLCMVKRSWAVSHHIKGGVEKGGDPNASVFKDLQEPAPSTLFSAFDTTYKKYTVQRKANIGRHERILAIDGDYIHIMPPEGKTHGFTTSSVRTASYYMSNIIGVKQSRKTPSIFKLLVTKEGGLQKTYEFEAESQRVATEIVGLIRDLMRLYVPERRQADTLLRHPPSPSRILSRRRPPGT
ncbi:Stress-activated MAP kinase-interacting protein, Sin1p [Phaffia rhodozyma]|uniref:Stress-activated MAP kinase-interacting protein, Sin1p n=1 Tax=Phaffia rhodozyma TaxID=264483 RepID=A0A0F7SJM6_PHARH|nr:Stress-activated MAP kinase-interacting protein, Sin1p [Phaffia rhodozyma]